MNDPRYPIGKFGFEGALSEAQRKYRHSSSIRLIAKADGR